MVNIMKSLFNHSRISPAELYRMETKDKDNNVTIKQLNEGAKRQWARLHDPSFQTNDMIAILDRVCPPSKK